MEFKNKFAGVVLLTALLSASTAFAAQEQSFFSKALEKTTSIAQTAAAAMRRKPAAVLAALGGGLGYLALQANAYTDKAYIGHDGAETLRNYLAAGAVVLLGAAAWVKTSETKHVTFSDANDVREFYKSKPVAASVAESPEGDIAAKPTPVRPRGRRTTEAERLASTLNNTAPRARR
jgi:hypothetical protein